MFKLTFALFFIVVIFSWAEPLENAKILEENCRIAADRIEFRTKLDFDSAMMLNEKLVERYSEMKKKNSIPEFLNPDIEDKNKSLSQFSMQSQEWFSIDLIENVLTSEIVNLEEKFPFLGYNDFHNIVFKSFLNFMRGEEWDIVEQMRSQKSYWDEVRTPEQALSPLGLNKIIWIYRLKVERREHGILHVGLDSVTHNFICYEHPIGIYYPERETIERIYSEIVQNLSFNLKRILKNLNEIPKPETEKLNGQGVDGVSPEWH